MNRRVRRALARGKKKIANRLDELLGGTKPKVDGKPEFTAAPPVYEFAERTRAIGCGGIGVVHQLVNALGLPKLIDAELGLIKQPRPYHDSDHVLNIAYNLLCGGRVLDDIEVRRNDTAFLDALGARAIPDPTTAGDFCRRFDEAACWRLMRAINEARVEVWQRQMSSFTKATARIDVDGSVVPTEHAHEDRGPLRVA